MEPKVSKILRVSSVADRLECDPRTIYRLCGDGELPWFRLGRRAIRIREEDLEAFIERQKKLAAEESGFIEED